MTQLTAQKRSIPATERAASSEPQLKKTAVHTNTAKDDMVSNYVKIIHEDIAKFVEDRHEEMARYATEYRDMIAETKELAKQKNHAIQEATMEMERATHESNQLAHDFIESKRKAMVAKYAESSEIAMEQVESAIDKMAKMMAQQEVVKLQEKAVKMEEKAVKMEEDVATRDKIIAQHEATSSALKTTIKEKDAMIIELKKTGEASAEDGALKASLKTLTMENEEAKAKIAQLETWKAKNVKLVAKQKKENRANEDKFLASEDLNRKLQNEVRNLKRQVDDLKSPKEDINMDEDDKLVSSGADEDEDDGVQHMSESDNETK